MDGVLRAKRDLVLDRDGKFSAALKATLHAAGVTVVPISYQARNMNAIAERFVLSIESECLDRMSFVGEHSLRRALSEFVEHYHRCAA